ncbi:DapA Dihydrodipicolinate synthase/N-acetylneuraminate lyase [Acidimicrobiia bacterium]
MKASTFVISITPFDVHGKIDEFALRDHLDRMADASVGVYLGGGGSGEGFTFTDVEARQVLEIGVDQIGGRVPVRAMGIEPRTALQMIEYIAMAADVGVDAVQVYSLDPGHGHRPTPREIELYLATVLDSISLPCVVSSHQSVGYLLEPNLLALLADTYPHLVGVNLSCANIEPLEELLDIMEGRVEIHVGGPTHGFAALTLGAQGFLSSEANLIPRMCASVISNFDAGDTEASAKMAIEVVRISRMLYGNGGIRATKAVMNRLGLGCGSVRLPQLDADDATVDMILLDLHATDAPAIERW